MSSATTLTNDRYSTESPKAGSRPGGATAPAQVLYVDDDPRTSRYWVDAMVAQHLQVRYVGSAARAVDDGGAPVAVAPLVLVIDLSMPEPPDWSARETGAGVYTGAVVARRLLERWPAAQLVFLTNLGESARADVGRILGHRRFELFSKLQTTPEAFARHLDDLVARTS